MSSICYDQMIPRYNCLWLNVHIRVLLPKMHNELFVTPLHKHHCARDSIVEVTLPPKYLL